MKSPVYCVRCGENLKLIALGLRWNRNAEACSPLRSLNTLQSFRSSTSFPIAISIPRNHIDQITREIDNGVCLLTWRNLQLSGKLRHWPLLRFSGKWEQPLPVVILTRKQIEFTPPKRSINRRVLGCPESCPVFICYFWVAQWNRNTRDRKWDFPGNWGEWVLWLEIWLLVVIMKLHNSVICQTRSIARRLPSSDWRPALENPPPRFVPDGVCSCLVLAAWYW